MSTIVQDCKQSLAFPSLGLRTSLVAQTVKCLSTMWETWVRSLGWEDPLERKWQSPPVPLPGKSHGQKTLVGYSPWGCKESDTTERLHFPYSYIKILTPKCGSIWRWGLWEVIRGHAGRALRNGISAHIEAQQAPLPFPLCEVTTRR